jgi:hypothetical protein
LVLALAFLSLFAVFIVALLGFASTAFLSTTGVHQQGLRQYAASAAIDTAIQRVRQDINLGRDPAFGGPSCNMAYPALDDEPAVTVTCTGQTGSGDVHPGVDAPANAILTLATSGVGIDDTKNGTLVVSGPIFSNSDIRLHNPGQPMLDATDMPVTARGNCGDSLGDWSYAELRCNFGGSDPDGNDPNYSSRLGEVNLSAPNPTPQCLGGGSSRVIAYLPGYYTNVALLSGAVGGCNSNTTRWFQPGAYYFDFDFDPAFTSDTWDVTGRIVGGTAKGWTPGSSPPATPAALATQPASCQAPGVQFIFGGASKVTLEGTAAVELCPSNLGGPGGQIVVYGQKTGAKVESSFTRRPVTATATPNSFAPTANVLPNGANPSPIDGQVATYTIPSTNPGSSTTMSMTGYPGVPVPPSGAVGVSYSFDVAHREVNTGGGNNNVQSLQLKVGACTINVPVRTGAVGTDTVAVPASCPFSTFSVPFAVDYVATAANGRSFGVELDGVELVARYTPAVARAQDAGASALIATGIGGGNAPTFFVWGTVYTTNGDINLDFKNSSTIAFDRGVIVRRLIVAAVPSADTRGSFRLGTGGRLAEFIASVDGIRRVRALVRFVDTSSTTGRVARIQRWSVNR